MVLLAVYAFVATPVQFWHSHSHTSLQSVDINEFGNQDEFSNVSYDSSESYCQVCAHHYSVYSEDTCFIVPEVLTETHLPEGEFTCSFPVTPIRGFSNKGPPVAC